MKKKLFICHKQEQDGNCNLMFTLDPYQALEQKKTLGASVFSMDECELLSRFPMNVPISPQITSVPESSESVAT